MELGPSRETKKSLLRSAKIFHYREFRFENSHFFYIFHPNRPLANFSLSPGHPRGPAQAGAQKVEHISPKMQKLLQKFKVYFVFLRVGVTKYFKLRG